MPNFYAKDIASGAKCPANDWKKVMSKPLYNQYGVCKTFGEDYKYDTDEEGNPLAEECLKQSSVKYYSSAESLELFDALYTNK